MKRVSKSDSDFDTLLQKTRKYKPLQAKCTLSKRKCNIHPEICNLSKET